MKWAKSLETLRKSNEKKFLNLLDRKDYSEVLMTVKQTSPSAIGVSGKIRRFNRQLRKGEIDLALVPTALKAIELKPDSIDSKMCGGQAFLNLLGNYFYDSLVKAKRVDTDKDGKSHPAKYFEGLDEETKRKREKVIEQRMEEGVKPPKLYEDLPGDDEAETEPSKYSKTKIAQEIRDEIKKPGKDEFIRASSKVSGVKSSIIEQVYDRGMKAWSTSGHRPGATAEQWAIARVYSFLSGGTTQKTADKDLWEEHLEGKNA